MKKILLFLTVYWLISCAYATVDSSFATDMFYNGDVILSLDKASYNAGDELTATITAANFENFPIVDTAVVVEIVKGDAEHVYPSQASDVDNVIYEKVVERMTLVPKSQKTVSFTYKIPSDAKSGNYRLEVYLGNERTPIVGMPAIFVAPRYASFTVTGSGAFPSAKIVRTQTLIADQAGQVGPIVPASAKVTGNVVIESASATDLSNLKLKVSVCEWDDAFCSGSSVLSSEEYQIAPVSVSKSVDVPVEFNAPSAPEAYSIRLELVDDDGRTLSLYRSRIVVAGETARVRKLAVDKLAYGKGEAGTISVLVSASPDSSKLVSKNVLLTVSLAQGGSTLYSSSYAIPELSAANGRVLKEFEFIPDNALTGFTVCSKLESSSGKLFDQYCYTVDAEKARTGKTELGIETSYTAGALTAVICAKDASGAAAAVTSTVMLYTSDSKSRLESKGTVKIDPCSTVSFNVEKGEYVILVNDQSTNKQYRFKVSTQPIPAVCGNKKCESTESRSNCCRDCGCGTELTCKDNVCVIPEATTTTKLTTSTLKPTTTTPQTTTTMASKASSNNLILGVIFVLVILVVVYFATRKKK